jgi:hypothetical protein
MKFIPTTIWLLIIEAVLLGMVLLLLRIRKPNFAALTVLIMILIPTGLMGAVVGGLTGRELIPRIVYGDERVKAENIKLIGSGDGTYTFSNGETRPSPKSFWLDFNVRIAFILGGAIVFLPAYLLARRITRKYAPDVYNSFKKKR